MVPPGGTVGWKSFINKVVKPVAAVVAPVIAPGIGSVVSAGIRSDLAARANAAAMASQYMGGPPVASPPPEAFPDGGMMTTAGRVPQRAVAGAMSTFGRWLVGARGLAYSATGKLIGVMRGQSLFRAAKVRKLAQQVGIDAAAVALGITAVDVAQLIATDVGKPKRRSRGISAADMRCTRRTVAAVRGIQKQLTAAGACRVATRRK